jgi:hypothetical protein
VAGKGDDMPPTKGGTEALRAIIRPPSDSLADSVEGPYLETAAILAVPDERAPAKATEPSALAMTECPTCHVATPGARFCTDCGAPLVQRRFCSGCGAHLSPNARFCNGCGLKVP